MRRFTILLIALWAVSALAEVSVGVNLATDLYTERDVRDEDNDDNEDTETIYNLQVIPSVIILAGSRLEIVPGAGFSLEAGSREDVRPGGTTESDWTNVGFGGGCGFFVRLIEGEVFRLSLGPDGWFWVRNPDGDDNTELDVIGGLPVNIDLLLTHRLFVRISSRLLAVKWEYDKDGDNAHRSRITYFDINSMISPVLGFYFTF
ncbi:MAG: hypothetical protein GF418_07240 [Chitinivibrionales bacterium]|nr:hypothetical protein [Chitinivibrionales bacterium]MBD3395406.1 hypothetical protein [Chitinivibrionales bacterium]